MGIFSLSKFIIKGISLVFDRRSKLHTIKDGW